MSAGLHTVALTPADLAAATGSGELLLRVSPRRATRTARRGGEHRLRCPRRQRDAAGPCHAARGSPNPILNSTRITFVLPSGAGSGVTLRLYDSSGRVVRRSCSRSRPDAMSRVDGAGDPRLARRSRIYFVRLHDGEHDLTQRLVLVQ